MENLDPRQTAFLAAYLNPTSETYSDAKNSALKAGYSLEYAENITHLEPQWLSEAMGRRKRMLTRAENRLEKLIDSEDEKVAADVSKFIAKTQGKNEGYSERTEITGKDGRAILLMPSELIEKHESQVSPSPESNSEGSA